MTISHITETHEIVTRKDALARGDKYYFSGKACKHGHVAMRHVGGGCVPCSRERTRIRNGENYRSNAEYRDRVNAAARADYHDKAKDLEWLKAERARKRDCARNARADPVKKERMRIKRKEYRSKSEYIEKRKAYRKKAYWENASIRDAAKAKAKEWYQQAKSDPDWVEKERERCREKTRSNPEGNRARSQTRRARNRGAEGTHTADDIAKILQDQNGNCAYCQCNIVDEYEVDHIMPLALGGSNWPSNLQCTCVTCNRSKGAKHPDDFAKEMGRY